MSRNIEYINSANLRLDGRRVGESRKVSFELGTMPESDGSCIYACGGTKVLAMVYGPRDSASLAQQRGGNSSSTEATIGCDVALVAFSGERRRNTQRRNKQAQELSCMVERILKSVLLPAQYPNSHIHVYVEILQQDGSEEAACINAAMMALNDARVAMVDSAVALTAGIIDGKVLLDLTQAEIRSQCPRATVVVKAHRPDSIVYMEMDSRVSEELLDAMVEGCCGGCGQLYATSLEPPLRESVEKAAKRQQVMLAGR